MSLEEDRERAAMAFESGADVIAICRLLMMEHPALFFDLAMRTAELETDPNDPYIRDRVTEVFKTEGKIPAIKKLRTFVDISLGDGKKYVDQIEKELESAKHLSDPRLTDPSFTDDIIEHLFKFGMGGAMNRYIELTGESLKDALEFIKTLIPNDPEDMPEYFVNMVYRYYKDYGLEDTVGMYVNMTLCDKETARKHVGWIVKRYNIES